MGRHTGKGRRKEKKGIRGRRTKRWGGELIFSKLKMVKVEKGRGQRILTK